MKVYTCLYFELDDRYPAWYGEATMYCNHAKKLNGVCDVDNEMHYFYCQKFCSHYKKGELRGEWKISDDEKKMAKRLKDNASEENKKWMTGQKTE